MPLPYSDTPDIIEIKKKVRNVTKNPWFPNVIKKIAGLQFGGKGYVVLLNKNNADIIKKQIDGNENYNAGLYEKLYEYYVNKIGEASLKEDKEAIKLLIRMIDIENNTNVWRSNTGKNSIKKMASYICEKNNNFWNRLENNETDLVDDLLKDSKNKTSNEGRKSLASKVCRYFCKRFCKNNDGYYVNDSVVRRVLPYYLQFYNQPAPQKEINKMTYAELHEHLEAIREYLINAKGETLTREEIDHIMWYSYRFQNI